VEVLEKVKNQIRDFVEVCHYPKALDLLEKLATGKMLRSKLILKIAKESDESDKIIRLCAVVEMIHAASLLHDDVIDEAERSGSGDDTEVRIFRDKSVYAFYYERFSRVPL
jgi:octaprenyl-diphosphate synthase